MPQVNNLINDTYILISIIQMKALIVRQKVHFYVYQQLGQSYKGLINLNHSKQSQNSTCHVNAIPDKKKE